MDKKLKTGDLVVYSSPNLLELKNKIGIVISDEVLTIYQLDSFMFVNWYLVRFGDLDLIVSEDMITKVNI
jgi:hypothetical protein